MTAPPAAARRELSSPGGPRAVVADAMLTKAKTCQRSVLVHDVRAMFADDHVHAVLVLDGAVLLTVIERADLDPAAATGDLAQEALADDARAEALGSLQGRVVGPHAPLEQTRRAMVEAGRRRLAVVGPDGTYLGLLCLKRTGDGFCSDADVLARSAQADQSA